MSAPTINPLFVALADQLLNAETWIFDLDNTLYPASSRLFDQVDWNMTHYVSKLLDLEETEARALQKQYFREFGTTMHGLMEKHAVNPADFLDYVHNIDLSPISVDDVLIDAWKSGCRGEKLYSQTAPLLTQTTSRSTLA